MTKSIITGFLLCSMPGHMIVDVRKYAGTLMHGVLRSSHGVNQAQDQAQNADTRKADKVIQPDFLGSRVRHYLGAKLYSAPG